MISRLGAATILRCRIHVGRVAAAIFALAILPSAVFAAALPAPVLRSSEALDIKRLGTVVDDERALLRVEWRTATTGLDEAQTVQEMLARLRSMEGTISEIGRLIDGMPATTAVAAMVAVEPVEPGGHDERWALAASAAAVLLAFWWTRRRDSPKRSGKAVYASTGDRPVVAAIPASLHDVTPLAVAVPTITPFSVNPAAGSSAAFETSHTPEPSAKSSVKKHQSEDSTATVSVQRQIASDTESAASSVLTSLEPTAFALTGEIPHIDFSLEDEDPEAVARANARVPVPRARSGSQHAPERRQETNVEATLQLAEIMLSMGLEQGAAQALLEYIDANPRHALYHWLKLLGIYRKRGLHQEFIETAEKLRQNFNIQAEAWTQVDTGVVPTLENFPRVSEHVQETWSRPEECRPYLQHLLEDNRDGGRAGFPQSVAEEILLLVEILKEVSGADHVAAT